MAARVGILGQATAMRLSVERLTGARGGEILFRDLSFAIEVGEALVVTGPNGVGKSTLLRMVAGLLMPEAGLVHLDGAGDAYEQSGEACHYLGHRNGMKRELTVWENLGFWASFLGSCDRAVPPREAAAKVGLGGLIHLPFGYLSAGQQRRIAMARLLVSHRPVWILDEPTAALDQAAERMFSGLVEAHLAAGGLALIATHQPLAIGKTRSLVLAPELAA